MSPSDAMILDHEDRVAAFDRAATRWSQIRQVPAPDCAPSEINRPAHRFEE